MTDIEYHLLGAIHSQVYGPLPDYRLPPASLASYMPEERYLFAFHNVLPTAMGIKCDRLYHLARKSFLESELWILIQNPKILEANDWKAWLYKALRNNARNSVKPPKFTCELFETTPNNSYENDFMQPEDLTALSKAVGQLTTSVFRGRAHQKEIERELDSVKEEISRLGTDKPAVKKEVRLARRRYLAGLNC